jgi:cytoskeletal protein CcmA (bactofilin family)
MFNKPSDEGSKRIEPTTDTTKSTSSFKVSTRPSSVIGPTLVFKGELSADEDLVIEGTIEGTIAHQEKNLTVGKRGRVKANIHAKAVIIEGTVVGDIRCDERVELAAGADVTGNITSPRVHLADGANFNGNIEMPVRQTESAVTNLADKAKSKTQSSSTPTQSSGTP